MNSDFPRIITLLRKERSISQKQAAGDLGVSQALLSHYEKGIRECGLEFLVKAADYYTVSCDYLLGRSPEPAGKTISYDDIPDHDPLQKEHLVAGGVMAVFNKKLIINSLNIVFAILQKCNSATLLKEISAYIMLAVYKAFRIVYSANSKNDQRFFTVPEIISSGGTNAAMAICEANATASAMGITINGNDTVTESIETVITTSILSEDYPTYSSSLLNLIRNSEAKIQMINNSEK